MRNLVPLLGRRLPTRVQTSFRSHGIINDCFEIRFTNLLYQETHDTVWLLLDKLRNTTKRLPLTQAAFKHGLSQDEFSSFKDVVSSVNLDVALSSLRERGLSTTEKDMENGKEPMPMWLLLFLVTYKVHNRAQTGPMLDMVLAYLPIAPLHLKPSILVMTTLALARFNILSPLQPVVQTFLTTPLSYPTLQFNLLLQAMSRFPSSIEAANQVVTLLSAMKSRQIPLHSRTYDALLSDRFVTLQLVKNLRARMIHDGFVPTAAHLEAYLRVFAKNGAIHDAKSYLDAIRALAVKQQKSHKVPPGVKPSSTHPESAAQMISTQVADTLYIGSFHDDRASAFQYLRSLLDQEKGRTVPSDDNIYRPPHTPRFSSPSLQKRIDIYDWTTAVAVAARDKTTSSKTLTRLFENSRTKTTIFRPTIATYTVLIRALLHRRDYAEAERFWNMILQENLVLDRKALTVGLQVLTRIGAPHRAFRLLESLAAKPDINGSVPQETRTRSPGHTQSHITLNTIALNEFMVSLLRIGRPDIVFKLWDHMETLYGVSPDDITLNILLKAARLSAKLDDSIAGAFAQLASKNPFRKPPAEPVLRQDIVLNIEQMLADSNGRSKAYVTMMWNGLPAWQWAIKIFQQVILGNWPGLVHVQPPAKALSLSSSSSSLHRMGRLVHSSGESHIAGRSQASQLDFPALYPQIFPTDSAFSAYIQLLGAQSLGAEISLTLAWMRALNVAPSTNTLAMALVFWAEVSLHAPLIENWVGERSEYARLVRWIREWVGDERAPKDHDIRHWLGVVATMRTRR